jgi:hypothetical protein
MPKRFKPTPEADAMVVLGIVDEIENIGRITPPTAAELAERHQRDLDREHRRREREAAAERAAAEAEQKELAELERQAKEQRHAARMAVAERAKAAMAEQQRQRQAADERRRLSQLQHEWSSFKAATAQAQLERAREHYVNDMQQTINNLTLAFNPPPPPEPQIVYIEVEPDTAWGQLPTLPRWR